MAVAAYTTDLITITESDRDLAPAELINEALANKQKLSKSQSKLVAEMLKAASGARIDFDKTLI